MTAACGRPETEGVLEASGLSYRINTGTAVSDDLRYGQVLWLHCVRWIRGRVDWNLRGKFWFLREDDGGPIIQLDWARDRGLHARLP